MAQHWQIVEDSGVQRHAQRVLEKQITPNPKPSVLPERESVLQAAYMRLELSRFFAFEEAMSDPAYALSIGNMAAAIARGESADKIAEACANDQLNFRLQFTQAFRAELRTAISVQDPEVIDAS